MRMVSGVVDQVIFFVALDSTDLKTRETGLTTFTVYRSRNGGTATAMTTPTVAELSSANMPGVYSLLLDEDMTIDSGDDSQEMVFHITQASMAPVTRAIELYRPKLTAGETLTVASGVARANDASGNAVASASALTVVDGIVDDILVDTAEIGAAGAGLTNINLPNQTMDIVGNITGNLSGSVGSVTGAVGSVTGSVGSVTGLTASDVGAIKVKTDNLPSDPADQSLIIAATDALSTVIGTRASQTSVDDLPTNAELATSQAAADDATLAAIATLNNLSSAGAQAAAAAALTAYGAALEATAQSILTDTGTTLDGKIDALPTNAELAVALLVGVNVTEINGTTLIGDGQIATPWGPA